MDEEIEEIDEEAVAEEVIEEAKAKIKVVVKLKTSLTHEVNVIHRTPLGIRVRLTGFLLQKPGNASLQRRVQ